MHRQTPGCKRLQVAKSPLGLVTSGIGASPVIEFRLLGPFEVLIDGARAELGGTRPKALLAILLLNRGKAVSGERIADELWGETPPATAAKTVQVYVSRLRKALGEGVLVTRGSGYALEVGPDAVDADRFERLAGEGHDALDRGDARAGAARLRDALDCWRGEALADFAYESFAQNEIARLDELRLAVLEDRIDADLALGRHAALVPELETLVRDHPARERLRRQLMLALYRSGRQTDALDSYRDAQRSLDEELGLEPGPELRQLEQAILRQDPALAAPASAGVVERLRARRRGGLLVAFGGGLVLAAAVAAVLASGGEDKFEPAAPNSLAVIDPGSNRMVDSVPTGGDPTDVSAGAGSIWVANTRDDNVTQVDPAAKRVIRTLSPGQTVAGLATGAGGVWIADSRGAEIVRLDPVLRSAKSIRLAGPEELTSPTNSPVAVGEGGVWAVREGRTIARIDPQTRKVIARVSVGNSPASIAVGAGAVWVADNADNSVTRIDPSSANAVTATGPVGQQPSAVAVGAGAVWVANTQDGTIARVNPRTAAVVATIAVGERPTGIAVGAGAVWVANSLSGTVSRIDPATNRVDAVVDVGESPQSLTVAHGLVWVSVQGKATPPRPSSEGAAGRAAVLLVPDDPGSTDPAIGTDYSFSYATCALLYNYPDKPFPLGSRLQPEVADGPPAVSDDGRTYTFTLRPGFRFSPPSNQPVTAAAFKRAIERALDRKMGSYGSYLVQDIAGAKAFGGHKARRLAGVDARGMTLTIRLAKPVPNLAARLGSTHFCAVPPETPIDPEGVDDLPSAGPYYVASHAPRRSLVLRRNPNYRGPRPQRLAEIRYSFGTTLERGVKEVEAGRADYVDLYLPLSPDVTPKTRRRLMARYGPDSEAARAGHQQVFTQTRPGVFSFAFNTRRGPFADARLRRAVNYAIDRRALAREVGIGVPGRPTDQYLPPGIPGFKDAAIYPLGEPDRTAARRLTRGVHRRATLYTCSTPGCVRNAQILRSNLAAIGIDLEVRQFPLGEMFDRIRRPGEPWDVTFWGWAVDYADPFDFINAQFGPEAEHPGGFHDPGMDRRMAAASRLAGNARLRAYAQLDRDLARDFAPQATFASGEATYFLSARMGCPVLHPLYGLDVAALCVRGK